MSYVGFILVDKPQGWTSHDVVAKIRKHTGGKVGHGFGDRSCKCRNRSSC